MSSFFEKQYSTNGKDISEIPLRSQKFEIYWETKSSALKKNLNLRSLNEGKQNKTF